MIAARTEEGLAPYRAHGDLSELDGAAAAELFRPGCPALDRACLARRPARPSRDAYQRARALTSRPRCGSPRGVRGAIALASRHDVEIDEELASDAVVVAAGLGSVRLLRESTGCGHRLWARAATASVTGVRPTHALYLAEAKLALSPFDDVVRLAGVLELGTPSRMSPRRDSSAAPSRISRANWSRGAICGRACGPRHPAASRWSSASRPASSSRQGTECWA